MTSIVALVVGGTPEPWESLGFAKLSTEGTRTLFSLVDVQLVVDTSREVGSVDWQLGEEPFAGPQETSDVSASTMWCGARTTSMPRATR